MHTLYVIDVESTGLETIHDVIEISLIRFLLDSPDKSEQRTWYLKAMNPSTITEKALNINGHKREDILCLTKFGKETYKDPKQVISEIEAWVMEDNSTIDERVFIGQNPRFDYDMLKSTWKKLETEDTFPFGDYLVDTIAIAKLIDVCTDKFRARYNLASLVKDFKITKRTAHRASEDTQMTKDLFIKMISPIINVIKENFDH